MIELRNVNKIYKTGDVETVALKDIDLTIRDGADGREELLRHLLVESDGVSKTGSPLDDFK